MHQSQTQLPNTVLFKNYYIILQGLKYIRATALLRSARQVQAEPNHKLNLTIRQVALVTTTMETSNFIILLQIHRYLGYSDVNSPLLRAHVLLSNFAGVTGPHPHHGMEKVEQEAW